MVNLSSLVTDLNSLFINLEVSTATEHSQLIEEQAQPITALCKYLRQVFVPNPQEDPNQPLPIYEAVLRKFEDEPDTEHLVTDVRQLTLYYTSIDITNALEALIAETRVYISTPTYHTAH